MVDHGSLLFAGNDECCLLVLAGDVRVTLCQQLDAFIEHYFVEGCAPSITVDVRSADNIDSTMLGLIGRIGLHAVQLTGKSPQLVYQSEDMKTLLVSMALDQVFTLSEALDSKTLQLVPGLQPLMPGAGEGSAEDALPIVIDAHRLLMSISEKNHQAFKHLVTQLERSSR